MPVIWPAAIDSALNQDIQMWKLFIIDDGSTDQSRSIVNRYRTRVTAIYKQNGSQGSAFSAAAAASNGQTLCFSLPMTCFFPNKASTVARVYAGNPEIGLNYHRYNWSRPTKATLKPVAPVFVVRRYTEAYAEVGRLVAPPRQQANFALRKLS